MLVTRLISNNRASSTNATTGLVAEVISAGRDVALEVGVSINTSLIVRRVALMVEVGVSR